MFGMLVEFRGGLLNLVIGHDGMVAVCRVAVLSAPITQELQVEVPTCFKSLCGGDERVEFECTSEGKARRHGARKDVF